MLLGPIDLKNFESPDSSLAINGDEDLPAFLDLFQALAMAYAYDQFGISDLRDAWCTFRVWMNSDLDPEAEDWRLFLHWYIFHWLSPSSEVAPCQLDVILAEEFLKTQREELSAEQEKFLRSTIDAPLDFYEAYWLNEWDCYYIKSMFLGQERSFAFTKLPSGIKAGDIFLGKVVPIQGDRGVLAAHSRAFDSSAKLPIAKLRQDLIGKRKAEFVNNFSLFDSDVFNLYHDLLHES